jgi:hypothetical protein
MAAFIAGKHEDFQSLFISNRALDRFIGFSDNSPPAGTDARKNADGQRSAAALLSCQRVRDTAFRA